MSFIYRQAIAVADRFVPAKMAPAWNHPAGNVFVHCLLKVGCQQVVGQQAGKLALG